MGKSIFTRIFSVFVVCVAFFVGDKATAEYTWPECDAGYWYHSGFYCDKCPDGFNLAKPNAFMVTHCYREQGSSKWWYNTKSCARGSYLPKASGNCTGCPEGSWCPGGVFGFDLTKDQGIYSCPTNQSHSVKGSSNVTDCYFELFANGVHVSDVHFKPCSSGTYFNGTSCVACPNGYGKTYEGTTATKPEDCYNDKFEHYNEIQCLKGQYLPKNSRTCVACTGDSVCRFSQDFFFDATKDQGASYRCPHGYFVSKDHTTCIEACPAGQYMPADKTECQKCPEGYWCEAGNNEPMICSDNLVPNEDQTGCTEYDTGCEDGKYYDGTTCQPCPNGFKKTDEPGTSITNCYAELSGGGVLYYEEKHCDVGKYMPKNTSVCDQPCKPNHKCPGGQYYTSTQKDSGITKCGANETNNDDYSKCVSTLPSGGTAECEVGEYLPKNEGRCKSCTNQHKYCPGGKYEYYKSTDQGIFDCPANAVANLNHDKCTFNLSQSFMKSGPNGVQTKLSNQCWTKSTIRSYARCLFPNLNTTGDDKHIEAPAEAQGLSPLS